MSRQNSKLLLILLLVLALLTPTTWGIVAEASRSKAEVGREAPASETALVTPEAVYAQLVTSTTPSHLQTDVDIDTSVTILFTAPITLAGGGSISDNLISQIVTFKQGTTDVAFTGSFTTNPSSSTITLTPSQLLAANTSYTITVLTGTVKRADGTVNDPYTAQFTTGADITPPAIAFFPTDGAINVPIDSNISAAFNETVTYNGAPLTDSNVGELFTLTTNNINVPFTATYHAAIHTVRITPTTTLTPYTQYMLMLPAGRVQDEAGNNNLLAATQFTIAPDNIRPYFTNTVPAAGANNIAVTTNLQFKLNEDVTYNGQSLSNTNVGNLLTLTGPQGAISYTATYDATTRTITINPDADLRAGTTYTAVLPASRVRDLANNDNNYFSMTFQTAQDNTVLNASLYPLNNQTAVPTITNLMVTFSKPVYFYTNADLTSQNATGTYIFKDSASNIIATNATYNPETRILTITPTAPLKYESSYTLQLRTNTLKDSAGTFLPALTSTFTTSVDTTPPAIIFSPDNGAVNIPLNTSLLLSFTKPITVQTTDYDAFITIKDGNNTLVPFTASWTSQKSLTLKPKQGLLPNRVYLINVRSGFVRDAMNRVNTDTLAYFTTQTDSIAPSVTITPVAGSSALPVTSTFIIAMSEQVTLGNGEAITDENAGSMVKLVETATSREVPVKAKWQPQPRSLTLDPIYLLKSNTQYQLLIPAGSVKDLGGNPNASVQVVYFTSNDQGAPLIYASLLNGQNNVSQTAPISFFFNKPLYFADGTPLSNSNVGLIATLALDKGEPVAFSATWDADNLAVTITPITKLKSGTRYTLGIEAGKLKDANGTKNNSYTLTFTTVNEENRSKVVSAPENGEKNVPMDSDINLQFSKPVYLPTGEKLTSENVANLVSIQTSDRDSVSYTVQWHEKDLILTLTPVRRLDRNEAYTIYLPDGALKDESSTPVQGYIASFSTGMDRYVPEVISFPLAGQTDVEVNKPIIVGFDQAVRLSGNRPLTNENVGSIVTIYDDKFTKVEATYEYDSKSNSIKVTPRIDLKLNSTYSLIVESGTVFSTRVKKGNAGYIATFKTASKSEPPKIISNIKNGDENISIRKNVEITFSTDVLLANGTALSSANVNGLVKLVDGEGKVESAKYSWNSTRKKLTLDPRLNLRRSKTYFIHVAAGTFRDVSGNLNEEFIGQFTTQK